MEKFFAKNALVMIWIVLAALAVMYYALRGIGF
jgi:hypothetical protein